MGFLKKKTRKYLKKHEINRFFLKYRKLKKNSINLLLCFLITNNFDFVLQRGYFLFELQKRINPYNEIIQIRVIPRDQFNSASFFENQAKREQILRIFLYSLVFFAFFPTKFPKTQ